MASPPAAGAGASSGEKARMDGDAAAAREEEGVWCGICLTDAQRSVRGELDCCAHHFCFVCIMAWARVESRCPFCKARFRTIRRPPVPGRFPSQRVVAVSERNQACNPSGNGTSTVDADLYANTSCSICSLSNDDELLLLCELCDSAMHTYCVGLGTEIPEGDWFCKDCTTAKEEHSSCEIDDDNSSDHDEFKITIEVPIDDPVAASSILDIVDEGHSPSLVQRSSVQSSRPSIYDIVDDDYTTIPIGRVNARSARLDRSAEHLPSQSISVRSQCPESPQERENGRVCSHARSRFESERARTLRNSRNLGNRIRELRENWSALRAGSIEFATHIHNSRRGNGAGTSDIEERHQSSTTFTEVAASSSGHANKISPKNGCDVRKAWKMLEMAKLSGGNKKPDKPSSLNCSAPFSMGNNRSTSYSPIDAILGHKNNKLYDGITQKNNTEQHRSTNMENKPPTMNFGERHKLQEKFHASAHGRMPSTIMRQESLTGKVASSSNNEEHNRSTNMENRPPTINFGERHKLQEKLYASAYGRIPSTIMRQESLNGKVASSSINENADQIFESSCDVSRPEKSSVISCPLTFSSLSGQSMVTSSLQLRPRQSQSTEMVSSQEPSATATSDDIGKAGANDKVKSSGLHHHERKRKLGSETHDDQGSKRSRSSCKIRKCDISFLVIRELKLLNIDRTYGSDTFKEVARAATHTVLASCGLEHSPSVALAFPRPVCKHTCRIEPLQSPALTDFCRECLCNFVKEVISSLLSGRKMDQTASSC